MVICELHTIQTGPEFTYVGAKEDALAIPTTVCQVLSGALMMPAYLQTTVPQCICCQVKDMILLFNSFRIPKGIEQQYHVLDLILHVV